MIIIESGDLIPCWDFIPTMNGFQLVIFCLIVVNSFFIPRSPMSSGFYFEGEKGRFDLFPESPFQVNSSSHMADDN